MSDNADDLLDELELLESAASEMQESVEEVSEKQQTLAQSSSVQTAGQLNASVIALESAKTSQSSAEYSQAAAEAAIKMAHEQKAQVMELSDSNIAWRQSLRTATNDLKAAKNAVAIMMAVTIAFSVIATGLMGWLFFALNKKYEHLKGDVLDIISTENTLFNKNLTLKVDQLSSLIEALAADIQRLGQTSKMSQQSTFMPVPQRPMPAAPEQPPMLEPEPETGATTSIKPPEREEPPEKAVQLPPQPLSMPPQQPVQLDTEPVKKIISSEMNTLSMYQRQAFDTLQKRLEAILATQQKIQSATLSKMASMTVTPEKNSESEGLTGVQMEQLNALVTSVTQQSNLLKDIQKTVNQQKPYFKSFKRTDKSLKSLASTINKLSKQITTLQQQQGEIDGKVLGLQKTTQRLVKRPQPYSYHANERVK